ncbi:putative peptidase family-domain-containing protein [Corynascus similis CBS 632.67]
MLQLDNFPQGEGAETEVYQRCIIVSGRCSKSLALGKDEGYVLVESKDVLDQIVFPEQRWPMCRGSFKSLVLLSPGLNKIVITSGEDTSSYTTVRYVPLLNTPPLHLAILIAKDSPLLIDCPPAKLGGLSTAHSSLDGAIAKFRMTAYMWQALTAEDLRVKGLGRRSFRLEEEWSADTLSQRSLQTPTMSTVPKIHLVRTDKTVAELRNAQFAQQNPHARQKDMLHEIFSNALLAHGTPFTTHARPIVAGLILDSHYNLTGHGRDKPYILAHAALGSHNPVGLSLGIFGSHLTYAWPRFLEEVPACLLDATPTGDTVGNDNGECDTMWRACAVGQGAFLHELKSEVGIAQVVFSQKGGKHEKEAKVSVHNPVNFLSYSIADLLKRFDQRKPLALEVTAMNGRLWSAANVWTLFRQRSVLQVPGTSIRLLRQSVGSHKLKDEDGGNEWEWGVMLKARDSKGKLVDATKIDIRVGCGLDGAVVYYEDGSMIPCSRWNGSDVHMGGHQARKLALPKGVEITKVALTTNLVPPKSHRIIGFYGTSEGWGMCSRFGIVTAPRDVDLPDSVYDMEELQNKPAHEREQDSQRKKRRRLDDLQRNEDQDTDDSDDGRDTEESCMSEGEDDHYDDGWNSELEAVYERAL